MLLKLINFIKHVKKIVTDKIFSQSAVEPNKITLEAEISHSCEPISQPIHHCYDFCIIKQCAYNTVIITKSYDSSMRNTVHSKQYTVPDG